MSLLCRLRNKCAKAWKSLPLKRNMCQPVSQFQMEHFRGVFTREPVVPDPLTESAKPSKGKRKKIRCNNPCKGNTLASEESGATMSVVLDPKLKALILGPRFKSDVRCSFFEECAFIVTHGTGPVCRSLLVQF